MLGPCHSPGHLVKLVKFGATSFSTWHPKFQSVSLSHTSAAVGLGQAFCSVRVHSVLSLCLIYSWHDTLINKTPFILTRPSYISIHSRVQIHTHSNQVWVNDTEKEKQRETENRRRKRDVGSFKCAQWIQERWGTDREYIKNINAMIYLMIFSFHFVNFWFIGIISTTTTTTLETC